MSSWHEANPLICLMFARHIFNINLDLRQRWEMSSTCCHHLMCAVTIVHDSQDLQWSHCMHNVVSMLYWSE